MLSVRKELVLFTGVSFGLICLTNCLDNNREMTYSKMNDNVLIVTLGTQGQREQELQIPLLEKLMAVL